MIHMTIKIYIYCRSDPDDNTAEMFDHIEAQLTDVRIELEDLLQKLSQLSSFSNYYDVPV